MQRWWEEEFILSCRLRDWQLNSVGSQWRGEMGRRFGIASLLASLYWVRRLLRSLRNAEKELRDAKRKVEKLSELKQSERSGRIQAEKELRQLRLKLNSTMKDSYPSKSEDSNVDSDLVSTTESDGHSFIPIGHVRTCFPKRSGTPRQPHLVPGKKREKENVLPSFPRSLALSFSLV